MAHHTPTHTADIKGVLFPAAIVPMPHHLLGLSFTASGYGGRIPTQYMVFVGKYWRRVYISIWSNVGCLYIGKSLCHPDARPVNNIYENE